MMATKKGVPRGTNPVVQGAERRAKLMAFLSSQESPQSLKQIIDALGWPESGTAYTARIAHESGLIRMRKVNGKNMYFMGNGEESEPEAEGQDEVSTTPKRKTRIVAAREVELVVAGVLVILGRNPASGRLRIVLEEM
jgi:hypothetical protein